MDSLISNITGGIGLWMLVCCCVFFLTIILHLLLDRKPGRLVMSSAETLLSLLLMELFMFRVKYHSDIGNVHLIAALLTDLLLTGTAVLEIISCIRIRNSSLTPASVKECMDELPVGICFYRDGGLTKLTNRKMNSISVKLTGTPVMNAERFKETVFSAGDAPVIPMEDGTAYRFSHREDVLDGEPIHELLAFDVTEKYRLTEEMRENQKKAQKINERLKALNSSIQYIIMDRETLQIKIRIHDSLGEMLLMTRHFLADPENTDTEQMLSLWRRNISLLKNEEREDWQEPGFFSLTHADSLGIHIELTGELPKEEALDSAADTAITVHVTNVLRHAEGDIAYISSEETADGYILRFTNNGLPPVKPVEETGGLANLRRRTEEIGGSMKVKSSPEFEMTLWLPKHIKEEYRYGIQGVDSR